MPLLVIQGDADQDVPLVQGTEVQRLTGKRESSLIVPGAHHNDVQISTPPVQPILTGFFRYLSDEPTGNLDPRSSSEVMGMLRSAVDTLGHTVVIVTDDAHAAVLDRAPFLDDGRIVDDMCNPLPPTPCWTT